MKEPNFDFKKILFGVDNFAGTKKAFKCSIKLAQDINY